MLNVYLVNTATLHPYSSMDEWNKATYGADVTLPAYIEYKTEFVTNQAGEDVESNVHMWINNRTLTNHQDLITIDGDKFAIVKIHKPHDWTLNEHIQLWLSKRD